MPLTSPKFIITTSYGFLSLVAYALVNYILLTDNKLFRGSFFKLFMIQSIFNCITYINSMITLRLPQNTCANCTLASFFMLGSFTGLNVFHTIHFHMAFVQYLMTAVVSGNRLTMMMFPFEFERYWRLATYPIVGCVLLVPFVITVKLLQNHSYYIYVDLVDGFATKSTLNLTEVYNALIPVMMSVTLCSIVLNFVTLYLLVFKSENRVKKSEIYLIFHSFVSFAIEAFAATITVINRLAQADQESWFMKIGQLMLPFVSDSLTLISPFLLIMCCSAMRTKLHHLFFRQNTRVTTIVSVTSSTRSDK